MNDYIKSYLNRFIEYENPLFAVMITGDWGSGKTHFIKNWKRELEAKNGKYKPLYISLYGIHSSTELKENINRQLHPFLTSKLVKTTKKVACGLTKTLIKCELGDNKQPVEVSYELDLLPLLQNDNKEIKESGKILIFDDIERCHINRVELLGFINYFVEHCACKVIVLCNEEKMRVPSEEKKLHKVSSTENENKNEEWILANAEDIHDNEYKEFKEKTIGTTFEIKPNVEEAVQDFITGLASDPQNLLTGIKPYIGQMLNTTNNKNLRVLRQCILDFHSVVKDIPKELHSKDTYIPVMRKFFFDLLITSFEIKANNTIFANIDNIIDNFFPDNEHNSLTSLIERYSSVPQELGIQILDYESVNVTVNFIRKGILPSAYLIPLISKEVVKQQPWEKLTYFWKLSNEEFAKNYKLAKKYLRERQITNLDVLFNITFRFVNLDRVGIISAYHLLKYDVLACFNLHISKVKTLEDLMLLKQNVIIRLNYYRFEEEVALWKDITTIIIDTINKNIPKFKSKMTTILENLNGENLSEISKLLDTKNPVTKRSYTYTSIFDTTNPKKVAKGILSLSNEERTLFRDILSYRYGNIDVSNYNEHKFYDDECENVRIIVEMLKKKKLKGIDKYSVNLIILQFERLLNKQQNINGN